MYKFVCKIKETLKFRNYELYVCVLVYVCVSSFTKSNDILPPYLRQGPGECYFYHMLEGKREKTERKQGVSHFYSCLTTPPNSILVNFEKPSGGNSHVSVTDTCTDRFQIQVFPKPTSKILLNIR